MNIKGLQRLTLLDYPEHIAATLFLNGCNFRCSYCHNPELVSEKESKKLETYNESGILKFLKERKSFIDGVCITGGEPTLNKNISKFLRKIKKLGYDIKLDTNGTNPKILKHLIKSRLVNYVAMDIKAPLERYEEITKTRVNIENIKESIKIIKKMNDYEFRTTIVPDLNEQDIIKIAELINGARAYYLQQFIPLKCLDKKYNKKKPYSTSQIQSMLEKIKTSFEKCGIRNKSY